MAEIVNLNRARKQQRRQDAQQIAAENRVRHGRTLAQKRADAQIAARRQAAQDGARLDPRADTEDKP